jgi:hypothetical protein
MRLILALLLVASVAHAVAPARRSALVPAHLSWDMNIDRAVASLTAAKLEPRHEARRGYFDDGSGGVVHSVEPELHWSIRHGRAEARFQWSTEASDWRLDEVQTFQELTKAQLATELTAFDRRFGKPHKVTADHRLWVRDGVLLVVIPARAPDPQTKRFELSVHYRRDASPAP